MARGQADSLVRSLGLQSRAEMVNWLHGARFGLRLRRELSAKRRRRVEWMRYAGSCWIVGWGVGAPGIHSLEERAGDEQLGTVVRELVGVCRQRAFEPFSIIQKINY